MRPARHAAALAAVVLLAFSSTAARADMLMAPADSAVIEGVVVDATTGAPLPGALVRIVGLGRQDVTHEGGEFHLLNLPAGRHTVLVERLGYRQEVRVVQLARRQTVTLRIEMRTSAIALPGLVVTGTTGATLGDRAIRPTTVVSGQSLARQLDATLAGTLQNEPGLAVTSVGPATARPVIRGLGGDRVLILEDGARVGDLSSTSSDHAVSVDPLNAQRIEVVRGPAALLYGSNAIGGVINVIRDEVPSADPDRATGMASVQGQTMNSGLAAGGHSQFGVAGLAVRGEGSYRSAGDLQTPAGSLENTQLRTYSLAAGVSRVVGTGHSGIAYRYYDNAYGIPGGFVGSHPEGVDIEMRRHSVHAESHLRQRFGPFTLLDLDAKYTNYYHRELEAEGIIGTEFGLLTGSAQAVARHEAWGRLASGAMGARLAWQDFAAGGSTDTPPSTELTAAMFILEELDVGRLRLQGGARFDWHRIEPGEQDVVLDIGEVRPRTFAAASGSVGALYAPARGLSVGGSVACVCRTPDTGELFSQGPHLAAYSFEVGNPDLEAEVGLGIDAFVRFTREHVTGEVAIFRNALDNYIYYRDTGALSRTGLPIYQATGSDAVLTGFEATASVEAVRHVVLDGVVSYVRGTLTSVDAPLPMMPPLSGGLTARYERPGYFAGLSWRAAREQSRVATQEFETATAGYQIFDADAGYRWLAFGRVNSLTLTAANLTDQHVFDHLSRIRDRDSGRRVPGPGRSASLIYRVVF
jgi:iron complex outermembrane recepter protein